MAASREVPMALANAVARKPCLALRLARVVDPQVDLVRLMIVGVGHVG